MATGNYVHTSTGDKFATYQRKQNKAFIRFWVSITPEKQEDFHTQVASIAASMNTSRPAVKACMRVGEMLRKFVLFYKCLKRWWHVTPEHLKTIERVTYNHKEPHTERIDAFLADYFTPKHPDEVLVQPQTLARHLRAYLASLDEAYIQPSREPATRARWTRCHHGYTRFSATLPDATAAKLDAALRQEQKGKRNLAEAFCSFIDRKIHSKVTIHTFEDMAGVTQLLGYGPIPSPQTESRKKKLSHSAHTRRYQPTPEIRISVQLLDGTCRFPGCSTPADQCELDHVVNFDEGGETSVSNLACLCKFHHNHKTSQRLHYRLEHDRTAVWYFPNGSTKCSYPNGEARVMFGQTWQEHERRRRAAA